MKGTGITCLALALLVAATASACAITGGSQPTGPTPTAEQPGPPTGAPAAPTGAPEGQPGPNELAGTSWVLVQMRGAAPLAGTQITLVFEEASLGGTACNSYGGSYTASGGRLAVGELASTMMACLEPEGVMEQEAAYLDALSQVTRYTLAAGQLTLGTEAEPSLLVFAAGGAQAPAAPEGWLTYKNGAYGFEVSYPGGDGPVTSSPTLMGGEDSVRIELPYLPGTNLQEKYLQVDARSGIQACASPFTEGYAPGAIVPEAVSLAGLDWTKESGADAGAGNFYEFISYSTAQGDACVTLTFVLHSVNAASSTPPLAEFDREAESAVVEQVVGTFRWLP